MSEPQRSAWTGPDDEPTPTHLPEPGRARTALTWLRFHRLELTSVALPLSLAVAHHWWWSIPAALSAIGWAGGEMEQRRTAATRDTTEEGHDG